MQELAKSISELVNSLNGGAKGIAEAMQRVAPDAWRVAVRQVTIDAAIGWSAWLAFAALIVVVAMKFSSNEKTNLRWILDEQKKPDNQQRQSFMGHCEEAAESWQFAKWCACCLAAIVVIGSASAYLPTLLNPQYAAASQLSERFLGR